MLESRANRGSFANTHHSPLEDVVDDVGGGGWVPLDGVGVGLGASLCDNDPHWPLDA